MKNVALFCLLGALLYGAWLIDQNEEGANLLFGSGINYQQVERITLPHLALVKKNGVFIIEENGYPAQETRVKKIIDLLNDWEIRKEHALEQKNEKQFFSQTDVRLKIANANSTFDLRIGDHNPVSGNFYLMIKVLPGQERPHLYSIKDLSLHEGFYRDEYEAAIGRFQAMLALLTNSNDKFAQERLIDEETNQRIERIRIDPRHNRWFELDLKNQATTPSPQSDAISIKNLRHFVQWRFNEMKTLSIRERKGNLSKKLSQADFFFDDARSPLRFEIYGRHQDQDGIFLIRDDYPSMVFKLSDNAKNFFLSNVNMYWNLVPNLNNADLEKIESFELFLGETWEQLLAFTVNDFESFEVVSNKPAQKPIQKSFNLLFNLLFAVNGFEQADWVEFSSNDKVTQLIQSLESYVKVEIFGRRFIIGILKDEIVLVDVANSYSLHYLMSKRNLSIQRLSFKEFYE